MHLPKSSPGDHVHVDELGIPSRRVIIFAHGVEGNSVSRINGQPISEQEKFSQYLVEGHKCSGSLGMPEGVSERNFEYSTTRTWIRVRRIPRDSDLGLTNRDRIFDAEYSNIRLSMPNSQFGNR